MEHSFCLKVSNFQTKKEPSKYLRISYINAIFISFFAALFGGTNTQISGPTAPMTAVSMVFIGSIIATNDGDVTKALPIILMVFFLSGLIQIGLGFLGLGKYIKYIPYPVVSGFMTAIGVIILVTQMA